MRYLPVSVLGYTFVPFIKAMSRLCGQYDGSYLIEITLLQIIFGNQEIEYACIHKIEVEIRAVERVDLQQQAPSLARFIPIFPFPEFREAQQVVLWMVKAKFVGET